MILSKDSEKLLKRLARQRKEYERKCNKENEYASPFSVTNTFSEIEKILPNQSYVSLRGLLNGSVAKLEKV
ncbi:hypothetical protein [Staphylococcus simulans]|uniref:hypothetical protein n=1 Tax=Staphylococcus simulans TaxID=1286 RepID=UPI0021CF6A37|nr:hypothetical protein [Staphylococcus simulans]UXR51277.1 hypothetical protein MUA28_12995 [Staphylococcus simulans]